MCSASLRIAPHILLRTAFLRLSCMSMLMPLLLKALMLPTAVAVCSIGRLPIFTKSPTVEDHRRRVSERLQKTSMLSFVGIDERRACRSCQLIFFGNDVNMFQLIRSHADSGKMPDWPYAGGAVIDQKSRVSGDGTYALHLTYFREKDSRACETFVGRMSLAYALRTQKPVWEGSKYRDAVKAIASGCSVDSTTVADGCTRRLGLATKEFIDHVQRGPSTSEESF